MSDELSAGLLLGDYEIVSVAGSGGMGVVYRAKQRSLDRIVALKVIRQDISSSGDYRDRFLREARLAASVDHPHVVSVYDVGERDGRLFLAMQWIDGQDLRTLIDCEGTMAPERAVAVAEQLAGALDAVHDAGLIHRDVKPANVLLRNVGNRDHAYLTDFGVAKAPESGLDGLTRTGWVVGTSGYLSPEQIMGGNPDARSDLYAMACLTFELMTGKPPFGGENEMALRWAHANSPRPQASVAKPALGLKYDGFFAQALSIDPRDRFQSGRAFAVALQSAHATHGASDQPTMTRPHRHAPTLVEPPGPVPTPLPPMSTPPPAPGVYPAYPYGTPPPASPESKRSGNPLALVVLAVLALAGIAAGALAAGGAFSNHTITRTLSSASATSAGATRAKSSVASSGGASASQSPNQSTARAATYPTKSRSSPAPVQHSTTPPSADGALDALDSYWGDIGDHNFTAAYGHLVPGSTGQTESQFVSSEEQANIQNVRFRGQVSSSSGTSATVAVVSLVTQDEQYGCRSWTGSYQMTDQGNGWLIEHATLSPRSCAG